jgi:hypothetical protein
MPTIANNICVAWPSTAASIPAGWTRETSLDTKHIRGASAGADADLVSSLGQATHTHTESGHTPVQNSHVHSVSAGSGTGGSTYNSAGSNNLTSVNHTHAAADSDSTTATNNSATITIASANNDPPYRKVIWIKPSGAPTGIPNGAYAFFSSDTLPASWTRQESDNFLKGADAAGDGTGTGGSATHTHSESGTHTHTQNAHTHTGISATNNASLVGGNSTQAAADGHVHTYTLDSTTATNNASSTTVNSTDGQPMYRRLNVIKNETGVADLPEGVIAIYTGSNASIPASWTRCTTFDDFFVKACSADGEALTTGGSSTHTHTGTCATTSAAHNHTSTVNTADTTAGRGSGIDTTVATTTHTHTWTVSSPTITNQDTAISLNANSSETNYPVYAKVIFVQYSAPSGPPSVSVRNLRNYRRGRRRFR